MRLAMAARRADAIAARPGSHLAHAPRALPASPAGAAAPTTTTSCATSHFITSCVDGKSATKRRCYKPVAFTTGRATRPTASAARLIQPYSRHYLTRLAVRDRDHLRVLNVDEVDWINVENEQIFVHVGGKPYPVQRALAELETRLDPTRFFRAHRSAIVNLDRVKEIEPWFKGSHKLRLTTGEEVALSRAQARALRKMLGW